MTLQWKDLPVLPACGIGLHMAEYAGEEWIDLTMLGSNPHVRRSLADMAMRPTRVNIGCRVMSCVLSRHVYVVREWFGHLMAGIKTADNALLRLIAEAGAIAAGLESDLLRRRADEIRRQVRAKDERDRAAALERERAVESRVSFLESVTAMDAVKPFVRGLGATDTVQVVHKSGGQSEQERALDGLCEMMPELASHWTRATGLGAKSMRNTLSGESKVMADVEAYRKTGFKGMELPGRVKLTARVIADIMRGHASGMTLGMLAQRYATTPEVVRKVVTGQYKTKATESDGGK